jgi:hypothetical protein
MGSQSSGRDQGFDLGCLAAIGLVIFNDPFDPARRYEIKNQIVPLFQDLGEFLRDARLGVVLGMIRITSRIRSWRSQITITINWQTISLMRFPPM